MVDVEAELNIIILAAAKKKLEDYERKRAIARKAGTVAAMELSEDELSGITELPAYMIELNKEQVSQTTFDQYTSLFPEQITFTTIIVHPSTANLTKPFLLFVYISATFLSSLYRT